MPSLLTILVTAGLSIVHLQIRLPTKRNCITILQPYCLLANPLFIYLFQVTKKKDLSDFYFGLEKNVAFGARTNGNTKCADPQKSGNKREDTNTSSLAEASEPSPKRRRESSVGPEGAKSMEEPSASLRSDSTAAASTEKTAADVPSNAKETPQNTEPAKVTADHYKRSDDALAAARARALARKKAKESNYEV